MDANAFLNDRLPLLRSFRDDAETSQADQYKHAGDNKHNFQRPRVFWPRFDIWTMRSMDHKIPVYLRGFSFGPCFDFLGRNRIRGSSFIGHHSLKSFSVLIRDALRGSTYQLFVSQPGPNAGSR